MDEELSKQYLEYDKAGRIWGNLPQDRIKKIKFPRIPQASVAEFLQFDDLTSTISDVLDTLGIQGAIPASFLQPLFPNQKMVGTAVTLRSIPERITATQGHATKQFIRMATRDLYYLAEPGDVAIVDFGGNLEISNMGGQSCTVAKSRGLVGAIVNGAVRDISAISKLNYPVWALGKTPISGKHRIEAIELNGPVRLHNVTVQPGDLIAADDCGVCVIPAENVETVLDQVRQIFKGEEKMRELIKADAPLTEQKAIFRKRYE